MENVTPFENLIIRACKSKNPEQRICSVISRFYYLGRDACHSPEILSKICEKYKLITLDKFVLDFIFMKDINRSCRGSDDVDMLLIVLINAIRLSPIDKFPGYRKPLYFRKSND